MRVEPIIVGRRGARILEWVPMRLRSLPILRAWYWQPAQMARVARDVEKTKQELGW